MPRAYVKVPSNKFLRDDDEAFGRERDGNDYGDDDEHEYIERQAPEKVASQAIRTLLQPAVPSELALWLASLQLSDDHARLLVAEHKLAFVSDCLHLKKSHLVAVGLSADNATRFMAAAAKLSGDKKRMVADASAMRKQAAELEAMAAALKRKADLLVKPSRVAVEEAAAAEAAEPNKKPRRGK